MKKIGIAVLLCLLGMAACTNDGGRSKEVKQLKEANTRILEGVDKQLQQYDDLREQYNTLREEYTQNPNNLIGKDSLHTQIRDQHDMLLKRHDELKESAMELIESHDVILERHESDSYPKDSIQMDYRRMNADLQQARSMLNNRVDEIMHMLDEQEGMLQYITS